MKKWKGVALSPDNERKVKIQPPPPPPPPKPVENDPVQKENVKPDQAKRETSNEPTVIIITIFFDFE